MTDQHPITPPPELIEEWVSMLEYHPDEKVLSEVAQWGANQELEACAEWLDQNCGRCWELLAELRAARRPKPPSLKAQALALLDKAEDPRWDIEDFSIVREALEALPND